jgi:neutral ceramidase
MICSPAGSRSSAAMPRCTADVPLEHANAKGIPSSSDSPAQSLEVELTAIRLGDTAILSLPGEVFVAIALEIRARSRFPATMFFGLANDYIGYIPSETDAGEGYEIVASRVIRRATAVLSKTALQLLETVAK